MNESDLKNELMNQCIYIMDNSDDEETIHLVTCMYNYISNFELIGVKDD